MFVKSLIAFVAGLAALAVASEQNDVKWVPHGGCGCRKPSSSSSSSSSSSHHHRRCRKSSSSSSSSHCPQPGCSPANSRKFVKQLMAEYNSLLVNCQYVAIQGLARNPTPTSIIEPGCESNVCCTKQRTLPDYLAANYACGDSLKFFQPTEDNIRMYANGTVVYTQMVLNVPAADSTAMNVYTYNYHWTPVYGCNFQLSYIDGNSAYCPTYVLGMSDCQLCGGL